MKKLALAVAATVALGAFATSADAGGWGGHRGWSGHHGGWGGHHWGGHRWGGWGGHRHSGWGHRGHGWGTGLGIGLAGAAIGGLIGSAIAAPYDDGYYPASYGYYGGYASPVVYNQPPVVEYVEQPVVRERIVYVERPVRYRRVAKHYYPRAHKVAYRKSYCRCR